MNSIASMKNLFFHRLKKNFTFLQKKILNKISNKIRGDQLQNHKNPLYQEQALFRERQIKKTSKY